MAYQYHKTESPLIVFEDEEFKYATYQPSKKSFCDKIVVNQQSNADTSEHPFIVIEPYVNNARDYDLYYQRNSLTTWTENYTDSFWKILDKINWCFQDIDHEGYDTKAIASWLQRQISAGESVTLCTGFYYYSQVVHRWLTPLFDKYHLDEHNRISATSHITALGRNWYNLMIEDISVVEPIIAHRKYLNFYVHLRANLHRRISDCIVLKK